MNPPVCLLTGLLATVSCFGLQAQNYPRIHAPLSIAIGEDDPMVEIPFRVEDDDTPLDRLTLMTTVSPSNLVATNGIVITGNGVDRVVVLYLAPERSGSGALRLLAKDPEGHLASRSIALQVSALNDGPVILSVPNQAMTEGQWPLVVPVTVRDGDLAVSSPATSVRVTATSSNPAIIPNNQSGIQISPTTGTTNFLVRLQPPNTATNRTGSTMITLSATDGRATNRSSFAFTLQPRQFAPEGPPSGLSLTNQIVAADVDADGDLDLLDTVSPGGYRLNLGDGKWAARLPISNVPASMILPADYDGDGDLDLFVIPSSSASGPTLFRNDLGTPLRFTQVNAGAWPFKYVLGAAWADFDGDGRLDLLLSGGGNPAQTVLMHQNASGGFEPTAPAVAAAAGTLLAIDFDGDGDVDFALLPSTLGERATTIALYANNGAGRFDAVDTLNNGNATLSCGWVDADGDGDWDLWVVQRISAVANPTYGGLQLGVYRQSQGRFTYTALGSPIPRTAVPAAVLPVPVWGDFDQDGEMDAVTTATAETLGFPWSFILKTNMVAYTALLTGDGRGGFDRVTFVATNLTGSTGSAFCAGDWNNDGTLDLASPLSGSYARIFNNQIRAPNLPPGAPGSLRATQSGDRLWLSWGPATDANQSAALTYNVRLGSTPGGNELVASQSLALGARLVTAPGNAGFNRWFAVRLPEPLPARVYWSVQAVDNGYAGSPFAPEQALALEGAPGNAPIITGPSLISLASGGTKQIVLRILDDDTEPGALEVMVDTTTPDWFGLVNLTPQPAANPSTNWLLKVSAKVGYAGATALQVTARDLGGRSSTFEIPVVVLSPNVPPALSLPAEVDLALDELVREVPFSVSDQETATFQLVVTLVNTNSALFPPGSIEVSGAETQRTLILHPTPGGTGTDQVEITVTDADGGATRAYIAVRVGVGPSPKLQAVQAEPGVLRLTAQGLAGEQAWVVKSVDLVTWERVTTIIFDPTGTAEWDLGSDPDEPAAFFRLETAISPEPIP